MIFIFDSYEGFGDAPQFAETDIFFQGRKTVLEPRVGREAMLAPYRNPPAGGLRITAFPQSRVSSVVLWGCVLRIKKLPQLRYI